MGTEYGTALYDKLLPIRFLAPMDCSKMYLVTSSHAVTVYLASRLLQSLFSYSFSYLSPLGHVSAWFYSMLLNLLPLTKIFQIVYSRVFLLYLYSLRRENTVILSL
jgi:hypothetical protein